MAGRKICCVLVLGILLLHRTSKIEADVVFADNFDGQSFANNDGNSNWSGPWIEVDPEFGGMGPTAGQVQVTGGFLVLDDQPDTGGHPSAAREVNLAAIGATTATLGFTFNTTTGVDSSDAVTVEASSNGGATFTTLEVITGIAGSANDVRSYDITPFISNDSQVRFRVSNLYGGSEESFRLDSVRITAIPEPSSFLLSGMILVAFNWRFLFCRR